MGHEFHHLLRRRAAAPLRPAGPALHLVPDRARFRVGLRCRAAARTGVAHQPGAHPAAAIDLRARAVLFQSLLLLRLQPHHHARHSAGRALPIAAGTRDRAAGALVRPRPRGGAGAPWRRHAQFPQPRTGLRAHGKSASATSTWPRMPTGTSPSSSTRASSRTGDIASYAAIGFSRASFGVQDFDPVVQRAVNRDAVGRADAGRRSRLPRQRLPLRERRPHLRPAEADHDRFRPHAGHRHRGPPGSHRDLRLRAHAADVQGADADRGQPICRIPARNWRCCSWPSTSSPPPATGTSAWITSRCRTTICRWRRMHGNLHRNFMGYTTHADCDLIGLGVSAISHIGDSFSQNPRELPAWEIAVDRGQPPVWRGLALSFDDRVRGDVIQQLMCNGAVDVAAIERRHDIDFRDYFAASLATARAAGAGRPGRVRPAARGRHVARAIAAAYHRHVLRQLPGQHPHRRHVPATPESSRRTGAAPFRRENGTVAAISPIADDGDELRFCSTCAFSAACMEQGFDKSRLGELHVLVAHVGPVRRRRTHLSRGRSFRCHRRGARRHGEDLRDRQRGPRAGAGIFSARRGHRPERDFERALSLQCRGARPGHAVPVFLSRHRGAGHAHAGPAAAVVPTAEPGHRQGGAAGRQLHRRRAPGGVPGVVVPALCRAGFFRARASGSP